MLWVGADDGPRSRRPAATRRASSRRGAATLRYGLTDRAGTSRTRHRAAVGRPRPRPARARALGEILSGTTAHGGALLAPFGVRFVVADDDDLPAAAASCLDAQVDLDLDARRRARDLPERRAIPPAAILDAERRLDGDRARPVSADIARRGDP